MSKMNVTPIEEVNYGVYLWQMPNGGLVQDEEGNHLNIPAIKGDVRRINNLKRAAKELGLEEGHPIWFAGHRRVTEEEYQIQKMRMDMGLIPDELDVPAIEEDLNNKKKSGLI